MSVQTTCLWCSKPAEKKCGTCKRVTFCNEEHQRLMWPTHKHRCTKDSSAFIQPPLKRRETDDFARYRFVKHIIRICKTLLERTDLPYRTIARTRSEILFPEDFYERLQAPEFANLFLIDALKKLSPPGVLPLDYLWEMCCTHGENVLPLSEEAHDWRCRFRHIFKDSSDVIPIKEGGFYGDGSYNCFYRVASLQMELRSFETTFPQPLLDEIFDICYNFYAVHSVIKIRGRVEALIHRMFLVIYQRYLKTYQILFDYEWKVVGDGWALALLSNTLCQSWVPASPYGTTEQKVSKVREKMEKDWKKKVGEKMKLEIKQACDQREILNLQG